MAEAVGLDVEALYRRERGRIHAMCVAILRDQGDAEDAVQETFARVAARAAALQGDPTGYLVVVARNVCRDELRRRARRLPHDAGPGGDPTPEETAVQRGLLGFVWRHLARVEQTLLAYVYSGMSMAEIGERTGTSGDVAAQRVSRLRRRIRNMVGAPAAILVPMLRGSAAGRAIAARLHAGTLLGPVLERFQTFEQAMAPLLVSVAAGAIAAPHQAIPPHPAPPLAAVVAKATATPRPPLLKLPPAAAQALHSAQSAVRSLASPVAAAAAKLHAVPPPDAEFQTFTPSPAYLHDHVVFATADASQCAHYPCATVWRSSDSGVTWKPLSTQQVPQWPTVALPPSWPADPTVFLIDSSEIWRSDDGGSSFRRVFVSTSIGHAMVDPTSQRGDTRIVFDSGTGAPLVYTANDDSVHPLSGLPTGASASVEPMGGALYLDVVRPAMSDTLYSCPATAPSCSQVGPGVSMPPLAVSPAFDSDHTYFDSGYQSVLVGTLEGGMSTRSLAVPGMSVVAVYPAVDYARSGVLDLVVLPAQSSSPAYASLRLVDGMAQPWALQVPPGTAMTAMTRLPDGRLLLPAPMVWQSNGGYAGGGSFCSVDDGLSWTLGC